jgi:prepilin-type N-terminal cleavage/methylation domain-containing protein
MSRPGLEAARVGTRRARRGFTIVELLVAMSAGLMVAGAAYALSRNALDVFQQEARGFTAQFSAMNGMTRLASDLRRAGFMTSANSDRDPFRCGDISTAANNPDERRLSALTVIRGDDGGYATDVGVTTSYQAPPTQYAANNRYPDRVRLAGNYATTEMFDLATYDASDGATMMLQTDSPAVARVFKEAQNGGPAICELFVRNVGAPVPRYATITTAAGQSAFVRVTNCVSTNTAANDNYDAVTLTVAFLQTSSRCMEAPKTIAPTLVVEYFVHHVVDAANATAVGLDASMAGLTAPEAPSVTGDADNTSNAAATQGRMELVRREINANGVPVAGSGEIVAEYVVDLKLGYRVLGGAPPVAPTFMDFGTTNIDPFSLTYTARPEHVRSALVRLSTRARTPDRDDDGGGVPALSEPLRRFEAVPAPLRTRYARVRSVTTEVALPNMANLVW